MALFGDDDEDEYDRRPKKSFLGSVGSFLWTAVKWVGTALLVATGIALLLKHVPSLRNTLDNWTKDEQGRGGIGSAIVNKWNSIVSSAEEFASPPPTSKDVAEVKEIKGTKVLTPTKSFTSNVVKTADAMAERPRDFNLLTDTAKAKDALSPRKTTLPTPEALAQNDRLVEDQAMILRTGIAIESWNKARKEFKDGDSALAAPEITMVIPKLSAELDRIGQSTGREYWNSLSFLGKYEKLHNYFNLSINKTNEPDFSKSLIANGSIDNFLAGEQKKPLEFDAGDIPTLGLVTLWRRQWKLVTPLLSDSAREAYIKKSVTEAIDKNDFATAKSINKEGLEYFSKELDGISNNDKAERYKAAITSFKEMQEYLEKAEKKKLFETEVSEANKAILKAASNAPDILKGYIRGYTDFEKDGTKPNAPAPTTTPTPETPEQEAARKANEKRAREQAAAATAAAPAASAASGAAAGASGAGDSKPKDAKSSQAGDSFMRALAQRANDPDAVTVASAGEITNGFADAKEVLALSKTPGGRPDPSKAVGTGLA